MELNIQENMIRDIEEKEAQEAAKEAQMTKYPFTATSSTIDKGKIPMEDIPQEYVDQRDKALIHTSEKIKQKLTRMASAINSQEIATSQLDEATQVTTIIDKAQYKQTQVEKKPLKESKVQVSSFPASTIYLTNS